MEQRDDILKRIERCIKEISMGKIDSINNSDRIEEDLGIDSMGATDLVFSLEDEFRIEISDKELFEILKVNDIIDLVIDKLDSAIQKTAVI